MNLFERTVTKLSEDQGISQAKIAKRAGYDKAFFNRIIKHPEKTSSDTAIKIGEILGLSRQVAYDEWRNIRKTLGMNYIERVDIA